MLNSIILQGRFAQELDLRYTQNNTAVLTVNLAVQRSRKDNSGDYPTDFIPCVFWGKTAENVSKFFAKGDMVLVRGRLESRKWQDKNGNNRVSFEVQVDECDFSVNTKREQKRSSPDFQPGRSDFCELPDDDSDVPF